MSLTVAMPSFPSFEKSRELVVNWGSHSWRRISNFGCFWP
jgi:hypothetical protein